MFLYNPYRTGKPVGNTEAFIGRKELLRKVEAMVNDSCKNADNAIVLYGQRRIGKTSILHELEGRFNSSEGQTIFVDLQDQSSCSWPEIKQELIHNINSTLGLTIATLEEVKQLLGGQNTSLVFLIDEFNVLWERHSETHANSLEELNKLLAINPQYVKWVFATSCKREDLPDTAKSSFGELPSEFILPLSHSETLEVIRLAEKNQTLEWPFSVMDEVWQLTAGYPFFIQLLCSHIWNHIYDDERTPLSKPIVRHEEVEVVSNDDRFIGADDLILNDSWRCLSEEERLIILLILAKETVPSLKRLLELVDEEGQAKKNQATGEINKLQLALGHLKQWGHLDNKQNVQGELIGRWIKKYQLPRVLEKLSSLVKEQKEQQDFSLNKLIINMLRDKQQSSREELKDEIWKWSENLIERNKKIEIMVLKEFPQIRGLSSIIHHITTFEMPTVRIIKDSEGRYALENTREQEKVDEHSLNLKLARGYSSADPSGPSKYSGPYLNNYLIWRNFNRGP